MKKIIRFASQKTIIALFVFFIVSKISFAQQREIKPDTPAIFETVILKFPDITSTKVSTAVQAVLQGIAGVSIRGHCPGADFLFIKIDRRFFPKNDDILSKITDANFVFEIISDAHSVQNKGLCSENQLVK